MVKLNKIKELNYLKNLDLNALGVENGYAVLKRSLDFLWNAGKLTEENFYELFNKFDPHVRKRFTRPYSSSRGSTILDYDDYTPEEVKELKKDIYTNQKWVNLIRNYNKYLYKNYTNSGNDFKYYLKDYLKNKKKELKDLGFNNEQIKANMYIKKDKYNIDLQPPTQKQSSYNRGGSQSVLFDHLKNQFKGKVLKKKVVKKKVVKKKVVKVKPTPEPKVVKKKVVKVKPTPEPKVKKERKKIERKKMDLDKSSFYAKYTVPMLNDMLKDHLGMSKHLSYMNKGYKVNLLEKSNIDKSLLPEPPVRGMRTYGIAYGKVKPYSQNEQDKFIVSNYNELHPLLSKKLDPKKHKIQYEMKLNIVLNKHQKDFIVNFINSYFRGGLMFHTVGAGKTLTAVVFAHYYLSLYPNRNVCIISPPSLLFNFVDGMREFGLDIRDNRFKFETYIKFSKNPSAYVNEDSLLIIDEIHNFRTPISYGLFEEDGKDVRMATRNALADKVMKACVNVHKVLAMTGTPFVNNLYDIENTMAMINHRMSLTPSVFSTGVLGSKPTMYDYFKYRISHFDVFKSPKAKFFPEKRQIYVPIKLNGFYENAYREVINGQNPFSPDYDEPRYIEDLTREITFYDKVAFNVLQTYATEPDVKYTAKQLRELPKTLAVGKQLTSFENAPRQFGNIIGGYKIKYIVNKIKENPNFKTIVYSSFIQSSLVPLRMVLTQNRIKFTLITGSESALTRQKNKERFNDISSGINVLLISKAGTEGVSTKNVRQLFLFESQWNEASSEQAIARAIRFKSHSGLPPTENYCNIYRLQICKDAYDVGMVKSYNNGSFKKLSGRNTEKNDEMFKLFDKLLTNYTRGYTRDLLDGPFYNTYSRVYEENKKLNNKLDEESLKFETLRVFINEKTEDKKTEDEKKFISLSNEIDAITMNRVKRQKMAGDVELTALSIEKEVRIEHFIKVLDKKVPSIEDFKEPLHNQLIKAIDDEKDVSLLLQKQRDILNRIGNVFLKETEKIHTLVVDSEGERIAKLQKIGEAKTGAKKLNEFFTPDEVADELLNYSDNIKSREYIKVLEPTAGFGSLVRAVVRKRNEIKDAGLYIDMCEMNLDNRKVLEKLYLQYDPYQFNLFETRNFLELPLTEPYDLIVMNPPFHIKKSLNLGTLDRDLWDGDFVKKAYSMLKDNGELLAIISSDGMKRTNYKDWYRDKGFELKKAVRGYKWKGTKEKDTAGKKTTLNLSFDIIYVKK